MEVRNPRYTPSGTIECEINHPKYGWIPFGAMPHDPEPYGQSIYQALVRGDHGEIEPAPED